MVVVSNNEHHSLLLPVKWKRRVYNFQTYIVGTHLKSSILMSTHNIRFFREIRKIILRYPPYIYVTG